jgi:hypothetical protein
MGELSDAPRARLTVGAEAGAPLVRLAGELDIAGLPDVTPELDALLSRTPVPWWWT